MSYDPKLIRNYFDNYAEEEWERLVGSPKNLMSLQIHQYYLDAHLVSGMNVLELGAGAGRFSVHMASRGMHLTVTDISQVQLDLAKEKVKAAGYEDHITGYYQADITDLSSITTTYDAVIAIGGPLSYTLDRRNQAMDQLLSVTKPGGLLILGVMSRYGSMQRLLHNAIPDLVNGITTIREVLSTGDDLGYLAFPGHHHHMFTADELRKFLQPYPVIIEELTATAYLTMQQVDFKPAVQHAETWQHLFEMELDICKMIPDGGSHMLAVLRKAV